MNGARAIAEETARASYGRLLAWLAARSGDVAAAEDALAGAFQAALEHWPKTGVPASPEAWLLTAARRKLIDDARRRKTRSDGEAALTLAAEEAQARANDAAPFPDERLKLLFICAHPAIDEAVRAPLMLQTVLGLDAARIASAFLVSPATMSARLVRVKRKIKSAGVPFIVPSTDQLPERIAAVLDAIYAAFGTGWNDADGAEGVSGLAGEAIFLARLVVTLAPEEPEAWGLLSLMLHAEARRMARRKDGRYIPLQDQDTALWDRAMIAMAESALARAAQQNWPGRYQYEAAIQSAHAAGRLQGRDVSGDVVSLYEALLALAPSAGAEAGYAAALSAAGRDADALAALDRIGAARAETYQPYWAVRAHVLMRLDDPRAAEAYDRAIGLSSDDAARRFLQQQKAEAEKPRTNSSC